MFRDLKPRGTGECHSVWHTQSFQTIQGNLPFSSPLPFPLLGLDTLIFHMGKELGKISFDLIEALERNVPSCPVPQHCNHTQE